ncbi:MAG: peptidoglycan-binding protein [Candidatus Binatia bacterium]
MATREIVHFKGNSSMEQANLSDIVGAGEPNEKSDVMLIQALCQLVGFDDKVARRMFGVRLADLPEPTGNFDNQTIHAIWGFQRKMAYRLLSVDGKIHPGNYHRRIIDPTGRWMTITLLNSYALEGMIYKYNVNDVISALTRVAPQLILTHVAP